MNGRCTALVMAALVALVVGAQPASAVLIYSEGFNGSLGTQPAGWAAYTSGAGIVSRNDGSISGAYEQRRTSTDTTAIGWYDQPDVTDPGAWRDTTMDILMRYSGGANNDNGVIFRANDIASASSGDFYHIRVFDNTILQLYRVRGGAFTQIAISSGGPSLSAVKDRLLRVQVYNIPDAETDNVRIIADYFDGSTDATAVVRHLDFTDDNTSAITSPGSVGVRSYIQVDNVRSVFNSLSVNNDNRYLLWYDDYYDNSGDRTSTHSAGTITQDTASRAARFVNIGNGALGLRLLDFDAETSQTEWRDVKVSALMRLNTMGDDNGRISSGLVLRETGVVGAYTGSYYHYRLVRDEESTDQAFAELFRFNDGTATLLDRVTLAMADVPESANIFLQFSGIGAHLTGMASLSADFSSPFGIIDYLDASPDVINSPGSVGYRVYGSEGLGAGAVNFDNLEVTHLIPEPATMALLALGGLGLLRRRRRKAARKALVVLATLALLLSPGNAHASLVAYDGFADGGGAPGPGQYLTGTASTNGSNNDSIIGQGPALTPGFTTSGNWVAVDPLMNTCYFRAEGGGMGYTDASGIALATTDGRVNFFRTPAGTYEKRARRSSDDATTPPAVMYFSGLLNTSAGRTGEFRITWGANSTIGIGFNITGNAIVTTGGTVRGTSAAAFAQGTTHFVVGKIVEGAGGGDQEGVTLWVDPTDLQLESSNTAALVNVDLTGSYYVAGNASYSLTNAYLVGNTGTNSSVLFDELRVGSSWIDVTPYGGDIREEARFQQGVAPTAAYIADSTYIRGDQATTNQDDDPDFENIVGRLVSNFTRALFEFDLTTLGRADTIDRVEFILTTRSGGNEGSRPITFNLYEYGFAFDETAATWNDPDGDGGDLTGDPTNGGTLGTLLTSATLSSTAGGLKVVFGDSAAFRTAVADALAAGDNTLRLILALDDESGSGYYLARFYDEEFGNLSYHPELVVLFTPVPEPGTMALLGLGGLGLLRRRRRKMARKALVGLLAIALLLSAGSAHAALVAYDGFADGGGSPGPGQYLTGVASTNGSDNDSIIGQGPSLTPGFTTSGNWVAVDPLGSVVYFRAESGGMGYIDDTGHALATTDGQVDLFRTPAGTYDKRARRPSDDATLPPATMYFSGLLNTSAGRSGELRTAWGDKNPIGIGLNNTGSAIVTANGAVQGTSTGAFAQGTTHFVVGRIDEGGMNDTVTLWVDPTDLTSEGANTAALTSVDLNGGYYVGGNASFSLTNAYLVGDTGTSSSVLFDELRVGTTWADVAPTVDVNRERARFQQGVAPTAAYIADSTYIRGDQATTNQDDDPDFENIVGRITNGSTTRFMRALFEFDLTGMGRADTIESAELLLTSRGGGQGGPSITLNLYEYGFAFDETTATWNDPAGDGSDGTAGGTLGTLLASATFVNNVAGLKVRFGDTQALRDAVAAAGDNTLRLILALDDESGSGNYFTRLWDEEYAGNLSYRPELVVVYAPVPEPGTMALLGLGGLGLWRRRRQRN